MLVSLERLFCGSEIERFGLLSGSSNKVKVFSK